MNPHICSVSWPQSWELRAALIASVFQELIRNRGPLRNRKYIGFLKIKRSLTDPQQTKQSWERKMELEESGSLTLDYTTNYRHQNSIVLAQKQKYRSIEQIESPGKTPCTYDQLLLLLLLSHFSHVPLCAPHRQQPTRLPHLWDSPGKNTGVGCHFLLQCMEVKSESEVVQPCPTLSNPMDLDKWKWERGSKREGIYVFM